MCGVVGAFWYGGGRADAALVARQADTLRHRGPDDVGAWSDGPVALAHRRLSILDLSAAGHQPMANEDGSVHITFNGEIYNWPELRLELVARGGRLRSRGDTEVLLHLWEERGPGMLDALNGMFAFALFDRRRHQLLLARDRAGEKPLYYHDNGVRIAFASELKALLLDRSVPREVDPRAASAMLTFGYVPGPSTIYRDVFRLPAGHRLLCDRNGPMVSPYWSLPLETEAGISAEEAVAGVRHLVSDAVRIRLRSDVPVGAFLSGGIDSSTVVALMAKQSGARIRTFSIGFEEHASSELEHARVVARHLGTEHHELVVRPDILSQLPKLVWGLDEPFSDDSLLPTHALSALARTRVGVALSGDGGDEAFAGYNTYRRAMRQARGDFLPRSLRRQIARLATLLPEEHRTATRLWRFGSSVAERHTEGMSRFTPRQLDAILGPALRPALDGYDPRASFHRLHAAASRSLAPIHALTVLDAQTYLVDDVLFKVDRMSMLHSLEVRAPLLDHRLLELAMRLPFDLKMRGAVTKWVLREAVRPLLPPSILERRKQGFTTPLAGWLDRGFEQLAREVLLDARCRSRGWLDPTAVEGVLAGERLRRGQRAPQLFTMVCLELWAQTWVDRPSEALAESTAADSALA